MEATIPSMSGGDAKLTADVSIGLKVLTRFFAPAGRIGAFLGAVKPEQIKIVKRTTVHRPYWRISAGYACRYLRNHSHDITVEDDVEAVSIYGKSQTVTGERLKLSDLLAKASAGASLGYGPIKISLGPLEHALKGKISSALGSRDKEFERRAQLSVSGIVEQAAYTYSGNFLFDATQGVESKEVFDTLEGRDLLVTSEGNLKKQGVVLEPSYTKEEAIEEVRKRLSREPDESPRRILEQEFKLLELSLIYIPSYDFTFQYDKRMMPVRLDGMTGAFRGV
jgi:hypothetical protein